MDIDRYILTYGGLSHGLFVLLFLRHITKINSKKNILLLGHIFVVATMVIRSFPTYRESLISTVTGVTGHTLILLFFVVSSFIYNDTYRITFSKGNDWLNTLCMLGQLGMIMYYGILYINTNYKDVYEKYKGILVRLSVITFLLLVIFYYRIALKQRKSGILMYPLGMICGLYILLLVKELSLSY